MVRSNQAPKPLSRRNFSRWARERPALRDNTNELSRSVFVVGGVDIAPTVEVEVVPVDRTLGGPYRHYELRLRVGGVRLGERASPPALRGQAVEERVASEDLDRYHELMSGFVPHHLPVDPVPRRIVRAFRRIPEQLDRRARYNTTVFAPDERALFRDTSYPWSAFGRCETNFGPFSGAMIGPRHLLTCNHGVDWTPPPGFAADWLTFTPAYFDGDAPFGTTYATHVYWVEKDNNNGVSDGEEGRYDYAVLVLNDRIGDRTGWLGTRRYTDSWDGLDVWWHIGYPADLNGQQRPSFQQWISLDGDDSQDDAHEAIYHRADVFPGQSGGAMFGFWEGDPGPRAVAVQSWQNSETNGASGGGDLVDLAIRARTDHP